MTEFFDWPLYWPTFRRRQFLAIAPTLGQKGISLPPPFQRIYSFSGKFINEL
jgi:hypothetical protein